ncbi:GNAT family N-acetyltransferase [Candidatus Poribacteria bacterium]|nr:GNAT family N-acetyltransferase [Candidatus Poribacteria bacterium]
MATRSDSEKQGVEAPRALRPEEHASALRLLNSVLRPNSPPSILQEYPLVLDKGNIENMRVIAKGKEVVAHAAVYFSQVRSSDLVFKVGGIGSVATHPAYRDQGLGSAVVRDCIQVMARSGCHFSLLWTQRHDFYRNLGYESAGSSYLFRVRTSDLASIPCDCRIVPFSPQYLPSIIEIHEREALRSERTREEYESYFGIPKTNTLVALRNNTVSAYAVMGKGEDLRHCVHEWGGNASDLLCLAREFAHLWSLHEFIVLAPTQESAQMSVQETFPHLLEQMGARRVFEYLAMIRIIDAEALSSLVRGYVSTRLGKDFQIRRTESGVAIRIGEEQTLLGKTLPSSPHSAAGLLARILFGPEPPSTLFPGLSALDHALPIPLFIWGLDSV